MQRVLIIIICIPVFFNSCRFKADPGWETGILAPLAHATFSLSNILNDSIFVADTDSALRIVLEEKIFSMGMDSVLVVPDSIREKTASLKTLTLGTRTITEKITLGRVASEAGLAGAVLIANHGNDAVIPPISNLSSGNIDVDAKDMFESATFLSGDLNINIVNEFPVDLTDITFEFRNKNSGLLVLQDNISLLEARGTFSRSYDLAGKTIEGEMVVNIIDMSTPGSDNQPVPIDTSEALIITLTASNMQVYEATAIFPAQSLYEERHVITYNLGGAEIRKMKIRSGKLVIKAASTIQDHVHMEYTIPEARKNGQPLKINRTLPPATPGDTVYIEEYFDISGYEVNMTGPPDTNATLYNTFYSDVAIRIDSTGKLVHISLADSVYGFYGLVDVIPSYAVGYMGQEVFTAGPSTAIFSEMKKFSGNLSMADFDASITFYNSAGITGHLNELLLTAESSANGQTLTLDARPFDAAVVIPAALDNPLRPSITEVKMTPLNSNVNDLMGILPDKLHYLAEVEMNPNGNTSNHNDFIYHESKIEATFGLEIPVNLMTGGLILQDTIPIDLGQIKLMDNVQEAILQMKALNYFPVKADMVIYLLNRHEEIVDSIMTNSHILAGKIDALSGRVLSPTETRYFYKLGHSQVQNLKNSHYMIIKAKLTTEPVARHVRFFSNYTLDIKINTDLTYKMGKK